MFIIVLQQGCDSRFVAYSCSEGYFKDVLHWEEEFMLVQIDCL